MSNLRRYYSEGNTYFVSCVTYQHQPLLVVHQDIFWSTFAEVRQDIPLELRHWVLIPDHFHMLVTPHGNTLSEFMRRFKVTCAARYRQRLHVIRGRFWQNRFWDHVIRDDDDMQWHANYIYINPIKHGLVTAAEKWQYPSFYKKT
jgi:putative transposase